MPRTIYSFNNNKNYALLGILLVGIGLLSSITAGVVKSTWRTSSTGDGRENIPDWPSTVSSLCSNFTSIPGRLFFAFMAAGGICFIRSNIFKERSFFRHALFSIGVFIVGTVPTVDFDGITVDEVILVLIHFSAAFCVFVIHPIFEVKDFIKNRSVSALRCILGVIGIVFFIVFILKQN